MDKINPFNDSGIANFEQFNLYPFITFGTLDLISKRLKRSVVEKNTGYYFGERLILIGQRGLGKTSALFNVKKILDEGEIKNYVLSTLLEDAKHFKILCDDSLDEISKSPFYLLIDFPDTIDTNSFKKFLSFLWTLIIHKNYNKINLIFSMNHSHFEKSFSYSEILGKFITLRLEPFNFEDTKRLIESRLKKQESKNIFSEDVLKLIYSYSKGIPRNIISACSLLFDYNNSGVKSLKEAEKILREDFFEQVINDRVSDNLLKMDYLKMIFILRDGFGGVATSKMDYIKKCQEEIKRGRISISNMIDDLVKFGVVSHQRGGNKNLNKIVSLT